MENAVIYARYSCSNQTEQSIEGQVRVCKDYAKKNKMNIVKIYIDRAMSGTNDHRPDFQRMLRDSNKKKWRYVLVYKLDRFSRDKYESTIHKHHLKKNGVKLISAMENIPDTPEGIVLEALLEGMNQYYSAELSQKVKRGMRESRLKGHYTGGNVTYGYSLKRHKLKINEEETNVVKYIFEQYSLGKVTSVIAEELKQNNVLRHNKPLTTDFLVKLLNNEKYTGIYRVNGEEFPNVFPQIISNELFNKVQKKLSENRNGRYSVNGNYLLRNKMICGYCKSNIISDRGTSKSGKINQYYSCRNKKKFHTCIKSNIHKETLENFIIELLQTILKDNTKFDKIVNRTIKLLESNDDKNRKKYNYSTIKEFYASAIDLEPLQFVNYLIKKIILFDDKIIIHLNNPTNSNFQKKYLITNEQMKMKRINYYINKKSYSPFDVHIYV